MLAEFCFVLFSATALSAFPGVPVPFTREIRATAAEQIRLADEIVGRPTKTGSADEVRSRTITAVATLAVVAERWPGDTRAVLMAGLKQADLWAGISAYKNAAAALEPLLPAFDKSDAVPAVYRRLGRAYFMLNRRKDAERAFDTAEKHRAAKLDRVEMVALFNEAAFFYVNTRRPGDAAKRYGVLAAEERLSDMERAHFGLSAAKQHGIAGEWSQAKSSLALAERLISRSRGKVPVRDTDALQRELERLAEKFKDK
jgi:tetratricopeptide (TPR) repeat protein